MKKLILSTLLCVSLQFSFAQNSFVSYASDAVAINTPKTHVSGKHVSDVPDALITYSKELSGISENNDRVFNKTLIWFYKSFFHSYDKIIMSDRANGTIVGRTFFYSAYKVPKNADSANASEYTNYNFDWTIKIDNGKVNFSVTSIFINAQHGFALDVNPNGKTVVSAATKIPYSVLLQSDEKMGKEWGLSKSYLLKNIDGLVASLNTELATDDDLSWHFADQK